MPIGDAAILMAADGYGEGTIEGETDTGRTIIRTSETIRNFAFNKEPDPMALQEEAFQIFSQISKERHMDH